MYRTSKLGATDDSKNPIQAKMAPKIVTLRHPYLKMKKILWECIFLLHTLGKYLPCTAVGHFELKKYAKI